MAAAYEKDGYAWNDDETLDALSKPARMQAIKEEYIKRKTQNSYGQY